MSVVFALESVTLCFGSLSKHTQTSVKSYSTVQTMPTHYAWLPHCTLNSVQTWRSTGYSLVNLGFQNAYVFYDKPTNDKRNLLSLFLFYAQLLCYKYLILCFANLHHED